MLRAGAAFAAAVVDSDQSAYGIGWFTLSLINAGLAQSKRRSGLGWWLASLLVGPLATLLIVVLDPARKVQSFRVVSSEAEDQQ